MHCRLGFGVESVEMLTDGAGLRGEEEWMGL